MTNWRNVRLLYLHELRMLVRAGRAVFMAVVLPAIIMPLMLFAARFSVQRQEEAKSERTYRYVVTGVQAPEIRKSIEKARSTIQADSADDLKDLRELKLSEEDAADPEKSLKKEEIEFFLRTYSGAEADLLPELKERRDTEGPLRVSGVPVVEVVYRGNADGSRSGAFAMHALLVFARREGVRTLLTERGFEGNPRSLFKVDAVDTASAAETTGSHIGRFLTAVLVMLMLSGGSIAAMDIVAGERERGTLETLLTTAAGKSEIIGAKLAAIVTASLTSLAIQLLNFVVYVKLGAISLPDGFALEVSGGALLLLVALAAPLGAAIGAFLLLISSRAGSYKEAQMYFLPAFLLSIVPAFAAVLPGLRLRSAIAFVPLANVSVAVREILMHRYDLPMIAVTFAVMLATTAALSRSAVRMLASEKISAGASDGAASGAERTLFESRVLVWFAVMWALIFAVAANVPALATFRRQLLFNEIVIFAGASALMIAIYKLKVRETLSLKSVPWPVWIAMILAAPAANGMAAGLFRILNNVFPISTDLAKQMEALLPKDIPTWQLYLFVAVLPGVVEELTFRGVLLHGLRRRFHSPYLLLLVGGIFGLFHFTLFRIGPTAFLGVLLTWIAVRTGSVFPGMILHILNNAFAVWAAGRGFPIGGLEWAHYAGATAIFGLASWIVWRSKGDG